MISIAGRLVRARTALRVRAASRPRTVVLTDAHGDLTAEDLLGQTQLMTRPGIHHPGLAELPTDAPLRQVLATALATDGRLELRSSGGTGAPRVISRGDLGPQQLRTLRSLAQRTGLRPRARLATALPGVHGNGLLLAIGALSIGAPLVDLSCLPTAERLALLHRTAPRILLGTPVHLADLLHADRDLSAGRTQRIDRVLSTAHQLDDELRADLSRHWRARVHDVYSTSETGVLTVDGVPLRGVRIRARDGLLRARTAFTRGRWLITDRGRIDAKGRVEVTGRADPPASSGGMPQDPRSVVRLLQAQPGVEQAGLRIVPDEELGRRTIAHVTLEPETDQLITPPGMQALVHDLLGASAMPQEVRISTPER